MQAGTSEPRPAPGATCDRCRRHAPRYRVHDARELCRHCYVQSGPVVSRALLTALVVGSVLTLLNQGDLMVRGDFPAELVWKVPLTYLVPYVVTTWGALTR